MPDPVQPQSPRFPILRQAFAIAAGIAIAYLSARFGIPIPTADQPVPIVVPVPVPVPVPAPAPAPVAPPDEFNPARPPVEVRFEVCDHPKAQLEASPAIVGPTEYQPYQLVKLRAEGVKPGSAMLWRVSPRVGVDRANTATNRFEFAAVPGVYEVELLVINKAEDGFSTQEVFTKVTVGAKKEEPKPDPKPEPKGQGKLDPPAALARIQFKVPRGFAGCTATVIGPRRADGRWDVLTANHCIDESGGVGAKGTMKLKDGRTVGVRVVVREENADLAWMVTEDTTLDDLPFANLAATNPAPGVRVWHAGYGVDVPGNREDGEVQVSETSDGQTRFYLSVSQGDSGGGVLRTDTNEVVSTVCCTSGLSRKAQMFGASVQSIRRARPGVVRLDELPEPAMKTRGFWLDAAAALAF